MFEKLRVVWQIPELRRKILLTLLLLGVYRIGFQISLPIVDVEKIQQFQDSKGGLNGMLQQVAILSASKLNDITIFGLGIMPYISASIIFQLLGSVIPSLEALQKEGESGRKKINEYTRYATVFLCLIQSWFFVTSFANSQGLVAAEFVNSATGNMYLSWTLVSVLTMTAGTIFLMWLGEQIDEYGIGNGISLLIMAGILAQMPYAGYQLYEKSTLTLGDNTGLDPPKLLMLAAMFISVVVGTVFITLGQRRITMQSAKHQRGRRVVGGGKSYLPLKVNQAGVMPIIFASSLLLFPAMIFAYLGEMFPNPVMGTLKDIFSPQGGTGLIYNLVLVAMIFFFCYFWTAISFNPKEISENLKNMGAFIPGHRPGTPTAHYLEKVMVRITFVGAFFLSIVAIMPTLVNANLPLNSSSASLSAFYGGTSLLIAVSVAFDLVQKIDSYLVMRNYKGLLQ